MLLIVVLYNKSTFETDTSVLLLYATAVGLVDYLVSDELEAQLLRDYVVFKIGK